MIVPFFYSTRKAVQILFLDDCVNEIIHEMRITECGWWFRTTLWICVNPADIQPK